MSKVSNTRVMRLVRHRRIRAKVHGTSSRPRLAVFRSLNNIYAQVIDDIKGVTVASASSLEPEVKQSKGSQSKGKMSNIVGSLLARRAKEKGIEKVVFDTGGYKYHGRIKAFAEAAREGGMEF